MSKHRAMWEDSPVAYVSNKHCVLSALTCCLWGCGDDGGADDGSATGTTTAATTSVTTGDTPGPMTSSGSSANTDATTTTTSTATTATSEASSTGTAATTGGAQEEGTFWVYVASQDTIFHFSMEPSDGSLTLVEELGVPGAGGPLAIDPNLRFLYARAGTSVEAFSVDSTTAALTSLGSTEIGFGAVYLLVDPGSRHLLAATFGGDEIAIFPIENNGSLGATETQRIAVPEEPHALAFDPSGQWVAVPHRTPDIVTQWSYDGVAGMLTANDPAQAQGPAGSGPRHVVFHPEGGHAYVGGEFDDTVLTFSFDEVSGQLALTDALSTLPDDFDGANNTVADIHITPDGQYVYASNRGHDSIAMYSVDPGTHALTSLGQEPTEARPREFEVSPRGRYLYAAGQDSGMLASYTIDQDTGLLAPGPTYAVGTEPLWVLAIELPPL